METFIFHCRTQWKCFFSLPWISCLAPIVLVLAIVLWRKGQNFTSSGRWERDPDCPTFPHSILLMCRMYLVRTHTWSHIFSIWDVRFHTKRKTWKRNLFLNIELCLCELWSLQKCGVFRTQHKIGMKSEKIIFVFKHPEQGIGIPLSVHGNKGWILFCPDHESMMVYPEVQPIQFQAHRKRALNGFIWWSRRKSRILARGHHWPPATKKESVNAWEKRHQPNFHWHPISFINFFLKQEISSE